MTQRHRDTAASQHGNFTRYLVGCDLPEGNRIDVSQLPHQPLIPLASDVLQLPQLLMLNPPKAEATAPMMRRMVAEPKKDHVARTMR